MAHWVIISRQMQVEFSFKSHTWIKEGGVSVS